jgi:hypothetical protein
MCAPPSQSLRSESRVANVLACSEQTANCTYIAWTYSPPINYPEPTPGTTNIAGTCYLKSGTARVPSGANYRAQFAGAARGVVFSSVSQPGTLLNLFNKAKIHVAGQNEYF